MLVFLKHICCLIVCVFGISLVNDYICKMMIFSNSSNNAYKMWRLYNGYDSDEVPIIGSSRAASSFVPVIIGDRFFNYGINGSTQNETLMHLRSILERKNNLPIIVNLDPWGITDGQCRADYSLVRYDSIKTFPGIRYLGRIREFFTENCLGSNQRIGRKGFQPYISSRTEHEWKILFEKFDSNLLRFTANEELVREYEAVLSGKHPLIVFVVTPIHRFWRNNFQGMDDLEKLEKKLSSYPNVIVIDMMSNEEFDYPDEMFSDVTHLNMNGAMRFSNSLKAKMAELNLAGGIR